MAKKSMRILELGYRPIKGRLINTAKPPMGGSGVPAKYPEGLHLIILDATLKKCKK